MDHKIYHFTSVCQMKLTSCNMSKSRHPVRSRCIMTRKLRLEGGWMDGVGMTGPSTLVGDAFCFLGAGGETKINKRAMAL